MSEEVQTTTLTPCRPPPGKITWNLAGQRYQNKTPVTHRPTSAKKVGIKTLLCVEATKQPQGITYGYRGTPRLEDTEGSINQTLCSEAETDSINMGFIASPSHNFNECSVNKEYGSVCNNLLCCCPPVTKIKQVTETRNLNDFAKENQRKKYPISSKQSVGVEECDSKRRPVASRVPSFTELNARITIDPGMYIIEPDFTSEVHDLGFKENTWCTSCSQSEVCPDTAFCADPDKDNLYDVNMTRENTPVKSSQLDKAMHELFDSDFGSDINSSLSQNSCSTYSNLFYETSGFFETLKKIRQPFRRVNSVCDSLTCRALSLDDKTEDSVSPLTREQGITQPKLDTDYCVIKPKQVTVTKNVDKAKKISIQKRLKHVKII